MLTTSSMSVDKSEYCHHFSASEFLTRNIGNCECEASLPYSHNWYSTTVEKWFVFFRHLFLYWLVWQTGEKYRVCACLAACALSRVRLSAIPWTVLCQAPLSMGFSRQEYWHGLPFPSPGDLSNSEIETLSLAFPALAGRFFTTASPRKLSENTMFI